jgi:hypothetical protein
LVCAATVLVAGCGGSTHKASSTTSSSTPATTPTASKPPSGIRGRLLTSDELAGFTSSGVAAYGSATQWLTSPDEQQPPAQAAAEKAMFGREGFQGGAIENLTGSTPDDGLSIVEQFRSPMAARSALAFYISQQKKPGLQASEGKYAPFKVPGISDAVGYSLGGVSGGINIAFARSKYYYLIGREGGSPRDIAGLNAAARHLYQRVRA